MAQQNPTTLTPQQARAAAMLASGRRMGATAKGVGIHRVTLWGWTQLPGFQEHMNELRRATWRSSRDCMRENVARASKALGDILSDASVKPQARVAAARVVLAAAGPLFPEDGTADALEARGLPPVVGPRDWTALAFETALTAGGMAGSMYQFAKTPGAAWVESGLANAFPESFERLRSLAGDEVEAFCRDLLAQWQDLLDREALCESEDDTAEER